MIPIHPHKRTTLLLNFAWQPIATITARAAFLHLLRGHVSCLDKDNQCFDSINAWNNYASLYEDQPALRSATALWPIPTVVVVTNKFYHKPKKTKMSIEDLVRFYKSTCQYCLQKFSVSDLTIDHIIPKSKGGSDDHNNRTLCCRRCNQIKGSKTPYLNIKNQIVKAPEVPSFMLDHDEKRSEWDAFIC